MSGLTDLVQAIQLALESNGTEVNTSVPGTVVSYDPKTNRAKVRPSLPRKLANGTVLDAPEIVQVPVVWPTSGMANGKQAAITLPLAPGDGVMLSFQQRSIENWLSGSNDAPDDPRQFDLSDCVATPGLNSTGVSGHSENLVIRLGKASITITPAGGIAIMNDKCSIVLTADGEILFKGTAVRMTADDTIVVDTPRNKFALETHVHIGVFPGPGFTGEPLG